MRDNRAILYCAHWKAHGQEYLERADSPEQLRLKIFGRAYSPDYNKVTYFTQAIGLVPDQHKGTEHV